MRVCFCDVLSTYPSSNRAHDSGWNENEYNVVVLSVLGSATAAPISYRFHFLLMSGLHGDSPGMYGFDYEYIYTCMVCSMWVWLYRLHSLQQERHQCFPRDCFRTALYDEISVQARCYTFVLLRKPQRQRFAQSQWRFLTYLCTSYVMYSDFLPIHNTTNKSVWLKFMHALSILVWPDNLDMKCIISS